jgi:hypothetical protein
VVVVVAVVENVTVDVPTPLTNVGVVKLADNPEPITKPSARVTGPLKPVEPVIVAVAVAEPDVPVIVVGARVIVFRTGACEILRLTGAINVSTLSE